MFHIINSDQIQYHTIHHMMFIVISFDTYDTTVYYIDVLSVYQIMLYICTSIHHSIIFIIYIEVQSYNHIIIYYIYHMIHTVSYDTYDEYSYIASHIVHSYINHIIIHYINIIYALWVLLPRINRRRVQRAHKEVRCLVVPRKNGAIWVISPLKTGS